MANALEYGVGYARVPRVGEIATLHAVNPSTGRSFCDQAVAIVWSTEDSRGVAVDCQACTAAMAPPIARP